MTTHVFVVDTRTFKVHLEHLFAGTGAGEHHIDFNNNTECDLHHSVEKNLCGMIADANRVRKDDFIIFYLQRTNEHEGKFYGIFKATSDWSFLDNNDGKMHLQTELGKILTFRTLIEPYKVYPVGVTEWEALDEIKCLQSPNQMLWSLIYRKLKGNRGNTMITTYESERLCQLIRNKNKKNTLAKGRKGFSFDPDNQIIIPSDSATPKYLGRQEDLNVLPRLVTKFNKHQAFELHLQAYIVKNIAKGVNLSLDNSVIGKGKIEWIGNEVSCGVGMQRIDIMLSVRKAKQRVCMPIELKAKQADEGNCRQIQKYVTWIEQYYFPNAHSDIQPILITRSFPDKDSEHYQRIIESFKEFNQRNEQHNKLKYIEYDLINDDLNFEVIDY